RLRASGLSASLLTARGLNRDLPGIAARLRYWRGNLQYSVFESGIDLIRIYSFRKRNLAVKLAVVSFAAVNAPAIFFVLAPPLAFDYERVIAKFDLDFFRFQAGELGVNDVLAVALGNFDRGRPDCA